MATLPCFRCMIAAIEDEEIPIFPLSHLAEHLQGVEVMNRPDCIEVSVRPDVAQDVWMCFPFHLTTALGWDVMRTNLPPAKGQQCHFTLRPRPQPVRMPEDLMHGQ